MTIHNFKQVIILVIVSILTTACDNKIEFGVISEQCAPPGSSARYGANPGPVIEYPLADQPTNGTVTVKGTCEPNLTVYISEKNSDTEFSAQCSATGQFEIEVNLSSGDGTKDIIAYQNSLKGKPIKDRRCFTQDTVPPVVNITNHTGTLAAGHNPTIISGTCETGLEVTIEGSSISGGPVKTKCEKGKFEAEIILDGPDGLKDVVATQTDPAGNSGDDNEQYLKDTTPPVVSISSPSAMTLTQNSIDLTGECEGTYPVVIQGAGAAQIIKTSCVSGVFNQTVSLSSGDGVKNIIASQTDEANNQGQDNRDFLKDATAPIIAITNPIKGSYVNSSTQLQGSCESGLTITLFGNDLASSVTTSCSSGAFSANVSWTTLDGTKTVYAKQVDSAGNLGQTSSNYIKDTNAPTITITSPVNGSLAQNTVNITGTCESSLSVHLEGSGLSTPSVTKCSSGSFNTTVSLSSGDGSKSIIAYQVDSNSNRGEDSVSVTKDTTAPALTISSPSNNSFISDTFTLTGTCESGLTVNISGSAIATNSSTSCSSGSYSILLTSNNQDGALSINVTQTDANNNTSSASLTLNRDLVAPIVNIYSPAHMSLVPSTFTITGQCETGINVVLSGAGLNQIYNTSCISSSFSQTVAASPGDGTKVIVASQTDAYDNEGTDTKSYIVDSTAPVLSITSPGSGTSTNQATISVSGVCENGLPVIISSADISSTLNVSCVSSSFSTSITFVTGDGSKVVVANQTDASGNSTSDSISISLDTTAPVINITTPAMSSYHSDTVVVSGTCESGLSVVLAGTGIVSSKTTSCSSGLFSTTVDLTAGDSLKNITATQTDTVGNSATDFVNVYNDESSPLVTIDTPNAGTTAQTGLTISGQCEDGLDVSVSGSGSANSQTVTCNSGSYIADIEFASGEGSKLITVSQVDQVGNSSTDSRNFIRDNTGPTLTIENPVPDSYQTGTITISGACENGIDILISGDGISTDVTASCSGGTYSKNIEISSGDGTKVISASQTDPAGNQTFTTVSVVQDTSAPNVTITEPTETEVLDVSQTVVGTCESGLNVVISGDITSSSTTTCSSGSFSAIILLTSANGAKSITATQTDAAGNAGTATKNLSLINASNVETFISQGSNGKVDILFVDDNSASMDTEQQALGTKFSSLASELSVLDWQIGITTTDCSSGTYGICGSLLDFPTGSPILTQSDSDYVTHFQNTIQRPETFDCILAGTCPSGNEQALLASITAMDKRSGYNTGFFRDDAQLAIVVLSDEDEQSDGKAGATTPTEVIDHFKSIWPSNKVLSVYGIIVQPGDSSCLTTQQSQFGGGGNYGTFVEELAAETQGVTVSICAPDYSTTLKTIGENVRKLATTYELANTPIPSSVVVNFTPSHSSTFTVSGNRVILETPPPAGTEIKIYYEY